MRKAITIAAIAIMAFGSAKAQNSVGAMTKNDIEISDGLMTPEALWAMGRIGSAQASPDGTLIVYQVGYYSVEKNTSQQVICVIGSDGSGNRQLTTVGNKSETDPMWLNDGSTIAYLCDGQLWLMDSDGNNRRQISQESRSIDAFLFSPDEKHVILVEQIPYHESIKANPGDLPMATGRLITDLNYRHWDEYVETIPHPFVAEYIDGSVKNGIDIMQDEPYECPVKPFGGIEQLAWSPDSRTIAYTSRKKTGVEYAISTDTDIYLYNMDTRATTNICKEDSAYKVTYDPTKTMRDQPVNAESNLKNNPGYDENPQFSPDGKYIAWQSMARDGYESDHRRLCVYEIATGKKLYVTDKLDTHVDCFCWNRDSKSLSFTAVWHGCTNVYAVDLKSNISQLTDDWADCVSVAPANDGDKLLVMRQSLSAPTDIYIVSPGKKSKKDSGNNEINNRSASTVITRVTAENDHIMSQLALGKVEQRWTKTTDGKDLMYWIVLPSHFDATAKYPTLLFCEGGPQSPVSQFWSYRWNFQIMAANGYVIIAPNRRGVPGFGSEWNEQVSGDWTGQCMTDLLTSIDDACDSLPYVDRDRLGAVGASFGGYSVYYLAGHHDGRFKCFIAHDGAFNLESMYSDTEEVWFSNWEYDDAFWNKDNMTERARRTYENSPHRWVDKWDTPILCIHGERDYRINANQGFGAFNSARLRGIPAELLLFPDENHWVLRPQNGILWQRTFFNWLDRWLK